MTNLLLVGCVKTDMMNDLAARRNARMAKSAANSDGFMNRMKNDWTVQRNVGDSLIGCGFGCVYDLNDAWLHEGMRK
jgi:hypothetical protein